LCWSFQQQKKDLCWSPPSQSHRQLFFEESCTRASWFEYYFLVHAICTACRQMKIASYKQLELGILSRVIYLSLGTYTCSVLLPASANLSFLRLCQVELHAAYNSVIPVSVILAYKCELCSDIFWLNKKISKPC
jgi:hypothetical protein